MCGLVGVYGDLGITMESLFADLWRVDQLRGEDSAGVAVVPTRKAKPIILKGVATPSEIMKTQEWTQATSAFNILMMGHNRAATTGFVTEENAHPFKHGHITLTHNGTLLGKHRLIDHDKFKTDSEAITYNINKVGIAKTYKELDGAATLVWWDAKYQTLQIASNGKRPFHYAYTEDKDALIWASELWMIKKLCKRKKIKLYKDEVYVAIDHQHYTFRYDRQKKVISFTVAQLEEFKWINQATHVRTPHQGHNHTGGDINRHVPTNYFGGGGMGGYGIYDQWDEEWDAYGVGRAEPLNQDVRDCGHGTDPEDNVIDMFDFVEGDDGFPVWEKEFTTNGMSLAAFRQSYRICMVCHNTLWSDYESAVILSSHEACCASCASIGTQSGVKIV